MSGPPAKRRRTRAIGPDSVEFAKAFTHKTITSTNRSGMVISKDILVPLVPEKSDPEASASSNLPFNDNTRQDYEENINLNNDSDFFIGDNINDGFKNNNNTKVCV